MTTTIPRASAILGAARTLAAKLLLAVPIDRTALSQAMTESAGGNDAAGGSFGVNSPVCSSNFQEKILSRPRSACSTNRPAGSA